MHNTALIVPTLNAGGRWREWLDAFEAQTFRPRHLLVIDSSSEDDTVRLAREAGFEVHSIPQCEFDHGSTRQLGVQMVPDAEIVAFLTQDAVLAHPEASENLLASFDQPRIGAVYGRQLAHRDAGPIATHARLFNYPPTGQVRSLDDAPRLGIKTAFLSNSFAAYRRAALTDVGGFPSDTIFGEDTCVAAKMLLSGWKIGYCADAKVFHSHDYGLVEEFRRYFDVGVLHAREAWIRRNFGQAEGEGISYVRSELRYLWRTRRALILSAMLRTALKLVGYKLGVAERCLPLCLKRCMSENRRYWTRR